VDAPIPRRELQEERGDRRQDQRDRPGEKLHAVPIGHRLDDRQWGAADPGNEAHQVSRGKRSRGGCPSYERIDQVSPKNVVHGTRYMKEQMTLIDG
jgi:hypothetical protein